MKNKKAYILYQYDQFKDDYTQVMEYYNLKELKEKNKDIIQLKNDRSLYQFITSSLEDVKHLLKDKYIIITENIESEASKWVKTKY